MTNETRQKKTRTFKVNTNPGEKRPVDFKNNFLTLYGGKVNSFQPKRTVDKRYSETGGLYKLQMYDQWELGTQNPNIPSKSQAENTSKLGIIKGGTVKNSVRGNCSTQTHGSKLTEVTKDISVRKIRVW